jgi:hypothetical protein
MVFSCGFRVESKHAARAVRDRRLARMMVAPIAHRVQEPPGRWFARSTAMLQNGPVWTAELRMSATLVLTEALPASGMRVPAANGVVMVMERPSLGADLIDCAPRLRVACRMGDRDVVVNAEVLGNR